jgi:type I restriction enzyme S subunit
MMEGWKLHKLGKILELVYGKSLPKTKRINGAVPVFGSNGIVGYHNEAFVNQPGIIVGRKGSAGNVAYSKIPFCPIDTTFYITQNETEIDLIFLYYALLNLDLKRILGDVGVPGLNREMAYLEPLFYPTKNSEQRKIAYVLSTIQKAIEQQDKLIKTTTELKKALMQKLFTEGLYGEKQKETEIDLLPESWEVKPLIETVEFIDYGLSKAIPKVPPENGVKIVSTADITREGELLYWKIRKTEAPKKTINRLKLNDGDLLFNWRNSPELIGKSTVYHAQSEPHIFASFILRICCGEKKSHNYYLKHLMNFWREEGVFVKLSRRAVNQANYNKNEISVLKIPVPEYNEQVEIAKTIGKIEQKIEHHYSKKQSYTDLFKTMLHELMTGQRRVNEIDFESACRKARNEKEELLLAAEPNIKYNE